MRIVIKIGTSTLVDKRGKLSTLYIDSFAKEISMLKQNKDIDVILVSSGAIGTAMGYLNLNKKPKELRKKQALASIGQPLIMQAYRKSFEAFNLTVSQILLTRYDFDDRQRYINIRNSINELLNMKNVIPIINENDTIAIDEVNFGDNDIEFKDNYLFNFNKYHNLNKIQSQEKNKNSSIINSSNNAPAENTSKTLTPSFTDSIYGINFQIPEGYETFSGTDNQNKGTMVIYDRTYSNHAGGEIRISVSTTKGNFYWDLSQNRAYDDVEVTINGHNGVLKSSGTFSYISGDKLVTIQGASQQQLESIIIQ